MSRKFLSSLGTTKYEKCIYQLRGKGVKTPFIQEALIKLLCSEWNEDDKIVIFLTSEARKENWFNKNDTEHRLKERLEKVGLNIEEVDIPNGKTEEEIWEIFEFIYNGIDEGDEIIFDITHGFRSLPMCVLVMLNYAKVMKKITVRGIYYGAYEANKTDVKPIFDLTSFDELLSWTQVINVFDKYGISQPIYDLFTDMKREKNLSGDRSYNSFEKIISSLNDFTNNIQVCSGRYIDGSVKINNKSKRSVSNSAIVFNQYYKDLKNEGEFYIKPLKPLFDKVEYKIQKFNTEDNLETGLNVVEWSIENNLIQQGFTALEETIKTYVCKLYGFNDTDRNDRENIVKTALMMKAKVITDERVNKVNTDVKEKIKKVMDELNPEIAKLSFRVSQKRNSINHFGFSDDSNDYGSLKRDLKEYYEEFKKIIKT